MTAESIFVFLFTDIENSTGYWENFPELMKSALDAHDAILAESISRYGGQIVKNMGDGVFAAFEGGDPLTCALVIQRRLSETDWGDLGQLRVRLALNAGPAYQHNGDYFGPTVNRTARLSDIGWGGQTLITPEVLEVCALPSGASVRDLGVHLLKDLSRPVQVYGLVHGGLPDTEFPPLRSLSSMHPKTLTEALQTAQELNVQPLALYTLVGVARLMAFKGDYERAAELLGLVTSNPTSSDFAKGKAWEVLGELKQDLPEAALDAATQRGSGYDVQTVIDHLLHEFG